MGNDSYLLFARPSFVEGMGRVVDFGDTLTEFNRSLDAAQADHLALWSDWNAVADDLNAVIGRFVTEHKRVEKV
jgi:hypothetical protein